jgi:hypothetical protein
MSHPQGHVALLAARMALSVGARLSVEQLVEVLGTHLLCMVQQENGAWSVRIAHVPGENLRAYWVQEPTLHGALSIAVTLLAAKDGGDA